MDRQKQALYDICLRVYPHATWDSVIEALEKIEESTMAATIKQEQRLRSISTLKDVGNVEVVETIEKRVVLELKQFHKAFQSLVEDKCDRLVSANKVSLNKLTKSLRRLDDIYQINDIKGVITTGELFKFLLSHYSLLD